MGTNGGDRDKVLYAHGMGRAREIEHSIMIDCVEVSPGTSCGHGSAERAERHSGGRQSKRAGKIRANRRGNTLNITSTYCGEGVSGVCRKLHQLLPHKSCRSCQQSVHGQRFSKG
ncbi:hypothetical protein HRUBRA_00769 [Pseudohaliea rubra DSM 19751]|uniref:Uncharacterized protein n=1 Tax=Pseudohaliea rubra DSM 19751 TaxID=1265313 RepID=A0A095VTD6_9GAMM|nr:hypothetical protein HRUBRA_00769 [Pseudohaliea rubra DSM 19751]